MGEVIISNWAILSVNNDLYVMTIRSKHEYVYSFLCIQTRFVDCARTPPNKTIYTYIHRNLS